MSKPINRAPAAFEKVGNFITALNQNPKINKVAMPVPRVAASSNEASKAQKKTPAAFEQVGNFINSLNADQNSVKKVANR